MRKWFMPAGAVESTKLIRKVTFTGENAAIGTAYTTRSGSERGLRCKVRAAWSTAVQIQSGSGVGWA